MGLRAHRPIGPVGAYNLNFKIKMKIKLTERRSLSFKIKFSLKLKIKQIISQQIIFWNLIERGPEAHFS